MFAAARSCSFASGTSTMVLTPALPCGGASDFRAPLAGERGSTRHPTLKAAAPTQQHGGQVLAVLCPRYTVCVTCRDIGNQLRQLIRIAGARGAIPAHERNMGCLSDHA